MDMIVAVIKPNKIDAVKRGLAEKGILGMTATECKGFAHQLGHNEKYRGPKMDAGFVPKVLIFVCVKASDRKTAIEVISTTARTGNVGDGKLFVLAVSEVMRIRTGELNDAAL